SSRRRHTRSKRDWSSDVCSSDLDKATTMGHIKKSHLEESKVLVPSNKELSYFTSIFSQLVSKKNQLAEESRILQHVRDTLLPKLISGEIELPDDVEVDEDVPVPGS